MRLLRSTKILLIKKRLPYKDTRFQKMENQIDGN